MSMPNIPDVKPKIDINIDDSINLLLESIAMEGISISKLMDAEMKKILFSLKECENDKATMKDVIEINGSVNKTIMNMIKIQMLLQFKLENVKSLIPLTTTTTTTTSTTTSTTSTSSTTTKCPKHRCSIMGKSKGVVLNCSDDFYYQAATLQAFLPAGYCKSKTICYHVGDCCNSLCMTANALDIKIESPYAMQPDIITIKGKGKLKEQNRIVNFVLQIWSKIIGKNGFQMEIEDRRNSEFYHNSGFVKTYYNSKGIRVCD